MAHAFEYQLDEDKWCTPQSLIERIPDGTMRESSMTPGRETSFRAGNEAYFIRIIDRKSKAEIAPLSYIINEARNFILMQRKNNLITAYTDSIYQKALKSNNAKILFN
jgi:hypothetical protein